MKLRHQAVLTLSAALISLILLLLPAAPCGAEEPGWSPERTWVFAVGVLKWKDNKTYSSFTSKNRRDAQLVKFFRKAGVPEDHIVYLKDREATKSAIESSLENLLKKTSRNDLLFLYYCGHGSKTEDGTLLFANYDAGDQDSSCWSARSIVDAVERWFKGSRALLTADCCQSGGLVEEVEKKKGKKISYAVMTSSSSREISTGNWTFTQAVLDGFSGNPLEDLNRDGKITLDEMKQYAQDEMQFFEEQLSTSVFTGSFAPATVIAKARGKIAPSVGKRVNVKYQGEWYPARVVEADKGRYKVRWVQIGFDTSSSDEWVSSRDVKEIKPVQYPVGSSVEVVYEGDWYPAKVLKVKGGIHYIHYDDYSDTYDEWVPSGRIRLPKKK